MRDRSNMQGRNPDPPPPDDLEKTIFKEKARLFRTNVYGMISSVWFFMSLIVLSGIYIPTSGNALRILAILVLISLLLTFSPTRYPHLGKFALLSIVAITISILVLLATIPNKNDMRDYTNLAFHLCSALIFYIVLLVMVRRKVRTISRIDGLRRIKRIHRRGGNRSDVNPTLENH